MTEIIKRNQVAAFFLFTFLISWTVWIGVGIIGQDPESPPVLLGVYGPTLAAVIVSGIVGKGAAIRNRCAHLPGAHRPIGPYRRVVRTLPSIYAPALD